MNTHDIDIELPPLPKPERGWVFVRGYTLDDEKLLAWGRAAIEADRKRRGEPVLVGWTVSTIGGGILHASKYTEYEAKRLGYSLPVYRLTSPQPAEPVKVPSDDDIRRVARDMYLAGDLVWLGFDKDENGEYTQPKISRANITLIRALLARYGQPAEPVKSYLTVKYDDKGDCLYVCCDSNEPADAEEDDKGILYRRAISDGRLVGITITNFMGQNQRTANDETHDGLQPQHLTGEHRPDHGSPA